MPAVAVMAVVALFTVLTEQNDSTVLDRVVASVAATPAPDDAPVLGSMPANAARSGAVFHAAMVESDRVVATGPDDWLVLTSGQDTLELHPDTAVVVRKPEAGRTRIQLRSGTVGVAVGKRASGQSFEVQTRYLVAIVKGTKFDVSTNTRATAVTVTEGRVLVKAVGAGDGVDVTPGRTATVSSSNPNNPELISTPIGGAIAAAKAAGLVGLAKQQIPSASNGSSNGYGSADGNGNGSANHSWRPRFKDTSAD